MKIKAYSKAQLLSFVESDAFRQMDHLPISIHRAISHSNNPRIKKEDPLLFIAYQNDKMVGYLGALPDYVSIKDRASRIAFMSCIWVDPDFRGHGVGSILVKELAKTYPLCLGIEYVERTKPIYDRTAIFENAPLVKEGIRIYFRSMLNEVLVNKWPVLAKLRLLFKTLDSVLNFCTNLLHFGRLKPPDNIEISSSFSSEAIEFIDQRNQHEIFRRANEEFNWITSYPWILNTSEKNAKLHKKYHFTSHADQFSNTILVGRNKNQRIEFVLFLTQLDGKAKLPYAYFTSIEKVIPCLLYWLQNEKVESFTCFHPEISKQLFQSKFKAVLRKKILKKTLISKRLKTLLPADFYIQDGDGDSVFT